MKRLVAVAAFLSAAAAFLIIVGGGLLLLAVESSGERGSGALLALCGAIAFAAAAILVFAGEGAFARRGGRAGALTAALLGALPLAALCAVAWRFSGFPYASATPWIDWPAFAAGLFFALGGVAVLATGYWRMQEGRPARARRQAVQPAEASVVEPRPHALATVGPAPQPRGLAEADRPRPAQVFTDDDDVRVTPVDLPSIDQFRRR